jgi:putative aldouronate transport system permease protein
MKKRKKLSFGDISMDTVVTVVLVIFTLLCLYPVWYVIAASLSNTSELMLNPGFMLWPKEVVVGAYKMVFENAMLMNGFKNSLTILGIGLPINMILTVLCAYFMSCKGMLFKKPLVAMVMFTMFFGGGMIPAYLNVKDLKLYNTLFALVLPGALSVYNTIICKTAIEGIPDSLRESAYIDGANDFHVLFNIVLPLIKPTLAVLVLYYGVAHWNSWFTASIYIRDNELLPVQNIIRSILLSNADLNGAASGNDYNAYAETIKYAAIVITTFPIMCIYPFLQKYFAKGVMIGAVKG